MIKFLKMGIGPLLLLLWPGAAIAAAGFQQLEKLGVSIVLDVDELDSNFCSAKDAMTRFVFPFASEQRCQVGQRTPENGRASAQLSWEKYVSVRFTGRKSELEISVSLHHGKKEVGLLNETFTSQIPWELVLADLEFTELLRLLILDSLPVWGPAEEGAAGEKQKLALQAVLDGVEKRELAVKLSPAFLSWKADQVLFRAEHAPSSNLPSVFLVNENGRGVLKAPLVRLLYNRLLLLTRQTVEESRATSLSLYAGLASDFVNDEPRFAITSSLVTALHRSFKIAFTIAGTQNSIPIRYLLTDEETGEVTSQSTTLGFDEVLLKPEVLLSTGDWISGINATVGAGYAFVLQKLSAIDLTSNVFPETASEVNDFAPSVSLSIAAGGQVFKTELFGNYAQSVGTGRVFTRAVAGLTVATSLRAFTLGVIESLEGYVGASARFTRHEIEVKFETDEIQGSLTSEVPTPSAGIVMEILL